MDVEPSKRDAFAKCNAHDGNVEDLTVVSTLMLGFVLHEIVQLFNARWVLHAKGYEDEDTLLYALWATSAALCFFAIVVSILNTRYMSLKAPHEPVNGMVKLFSAMARNGVFLGTSLSVIATCIHVRSRELLVGSIILTVVFAVVIQAYRRMYDQMCAT